MTRSFLFLQGPISPFFRRLGARLRGMGHAVARINLCPGDWLSWPRGEGVVNYQGRARDWPAFVAREMDRRGVTDLVLLGEQRPYHLAAIAEADRRGVAVTATDFGYIRTDWITLERDGLNGRSRFPREPAAIRALAEGLPEPDFAARHHYRFAQLAVRDVAYHLANVLPWPFPFYRTHLRHPAIAGYLGTGWRLLRAGANARRALVTLGAIPAGAPLFVFVMQMETDYSIRAYSHYDGMDDALEDAIASFARGAPGEAHLVCKVHPFDPGLKRWGSRVARMARAAGGAGRVHLVDGGPLDAMLSRAAGVVTVNSTAGLRAIQLGAPVAALGEALWDVEGLAHRGPLDAFWRAAARPDQELAAAWLRAAAHHIHLRGVYYAEPGLTAAVEAAAERLAAGAVGPPSLAPPGLAPPGLAPPGLAPPGLAPPGLALPAATPAASHAVFVRRGVDG